MALIPHPVAIAPDNVGVLIFHLWKNKIPDGIQVLAAGGGTPAPKSATATEVGPSSDVTLKNARLGFDSFLATCSISNPVVSEGQNGYCRVYVNWEVDPARTGYNSWGGGVYQMFLRALFNETYATAKIRREGKKVSVRFSDKHAERSAEAKIEFVAEKPATEAVSVSTGRPILHLPRK